MTRMLMTLSALALCVVSARAEDTPKAASTRKLLDKKISVDFKDTRLEDCLDEIKEKVEGLKMIVDAKGGVSRNSTLSFSAKDKTVAEVLDGMFKKNDLGYVVISKKNDAYDGLIKIKKGPERGYEKGEEPK